MYGEVLGVSNYANYDLRLATELRIATVLRILTTNENNLHCNFQSFIARSCVKLLVKIFLLMLRDHTVMSIISFINARAKVFTIQFNSIYFHLEFIGSFGFIMLQHVT